jgi:hypothetical protein
MLWTDIDKRRLGQFTCIQTLFKYIQNCWAYFGIMKNVSLIHACHLYYSYSLLTFPLLSRYNLSKCVRIQFLPPFSPTILYSMFVLFMRTQCKSPWKLFLTEMADIAWLISMSMSLDTNNTNPNGNIIQPIKNEFLMPT